VVIQGESGTGKELVARAIHQAGPRAEQPFVAVNCAAIPAGLLESELFGCAKGAFTGADRDRPGLIDVARGGTLFLDEVGDMNLEMQVKLLRVLQEGTFRRLGDRAERRSQCRVLAASHKELDQLVRSGAFREDLFYRLNVIRIHVPALRERREDIPLLVAHLLEGEKRTLQVAPAAMRALVDYAWPGNVRQLANELKRASLLGEDVITFASLSAEVRGGGTPSRDPSDEGLRESLRDYERRLIQTALEQTDFNVSRAAGRLKINRVVLHRRIAALGLSRPQRGKRV
jgi:transcriptional regulator with PAS, ATPase and Fis domain